MPAKSEAATLRTAFERLVGVAAEDVLIGGQALAVWVRLHGLEDPEHIVSIFRCAQR